MKPFNLKHALTTRTTKDKDGNEYWLISCYSGDAKLIWHNMKTSERVETDLDGNINGVEVLYSTKITKSTQTIYAVKTKLNIDYTIMYNRNEYPNFTTHYEIIFNLEDNEIKSIEHKKISKDEL